MILLRANYETTEAYLAALDGYLTGEGEVYVNRVKYDLSRECDRAEYLTNILKYQLNSTFADTAGYPGYDIYNAPGPIFSIVYLNGYATTAVSYNQVEYSPGSTTLTVQIGPLNNDISLVNTDITLVIGGNEFTETANEDGVATFVVFLDESYSGDIVVTSNLASAAANSIAIGYHGEVVDTENQILVEEAFYGNTKQQLLGSGYYAVGDADMTGTISQQDFTSALLYIDNIESQRLVATKFLTLSLNSNFYYVQGGVLQYTLTPTNQDYVYGDNYVGQRKSLDRLILTVVMHDTDGTPSLLENAAGYEFIELDSNDLAANNSYTGTLDISEEYNNPLFIVLAVTHAYNKAAIQQANTLGITTSITSGSDFEPGDTIVLDIAQDSSGAKVLGSLLSIQAYDNEQLTGNPVITVPHGLANYADNIELNVPGNVDKDLYLKIAYEIFNVTNRITYGFTTIDINLAGIIEFMAVQLSNGNMPYYPGPDTAILVKLEFAAQAIRSDYSVEIFALNTSTGNVHTVTVNNTTEVEWTFLANATNLSGEENIEIKAILSYA